jgi:hypothetical protein
VRDYRPSAETGDASLANTPLIAWIASILLIAWIASILFGLVGAPVLVVFLVTP